MEEFDLSVIAFLDGYDTLPELHAASAHSADASACAAPPPSQHFYTQQSQQQHQQHQHHQQDIKSLASPLVDSSESDASDIDNFRVLRETEQLLDSLEVSAFLDAASTHQLQQSHSQPHHQFHQQQQPLRPHRHLVQDLQVPAATSHRRNYTGTHVQTPTHTATNSSDQWPIATGTSATPTATTTGKSRNLSRERLKSELVYLRHKVRELEDELRVLRPGSTLTGASNAASVVAVDRKKAILPVWQRIAERQLEGRAKAEAENARLKDTLEGQLKLAKSLEQMLRKRPNVALFHTETKSTGKKPRLELDDDSLYRMLLDGIAPAYARMDAVFHQNGLCDTCDESIRHALVRTRANSDADVCDSDASGDDALYLELADVFVLPFGLDVSADAAWRSVTQQYTQAGHAVFAASDLPIDTIAVKFPATSSRRFIDMRLSVQLVMRRFVEADRMVLVWRSMSKGEHQLSGMFTDETGWCVLKRIPPSTGSDSTAPASGTVMQSYVHVVPKRSGSVVQEHEPEVGMLTNIVVDAYEDNVIAINKTMENLLLEDALSLNSGAAASKRTGRVNTTKVTRKKGAP